MKMQFTNPEIHVITFSAEDIITASGEDFPEVNLPDNETP